MTNYCFVLGRALEERGLVPETPGDFVGILRTVSPLHDIGKVGIPDSILLKPGSLTDGEREIMNTHTLIGASTLRDLSRKHPDNDFIAMGIEVTECHHEKWDGSGYPRRKAGKEIPLSARILAICDVYDALRSRRPYKPEKSHDEAVRIILDSFGSHFDPEIEPAFRAVGRDFDRIHTLHKDKD
jgi:putative two-component system response regulator